MSGFLFCFVIFLIVKVCFSMCCVWVMIWLLIGVMFILFVLCLKICMLSLFLSFLIVIESVGWFMKYVLVVWLKCCLCVIVMMYFNLVSVIVG